MRPPIRLRGVLLVLLCGACHATAPAIRLTEPAKGAQLVPVRPSSGCQPGAPPVSQGSRTLTSGGRTRRFILRLPPAGAAAPQPPGSGAAQASVSQEPTPTPPAPTPLAPAPPAPTPPTPPTPPTLTPAQTGAVRPAPLVLNFHGLLEAPALQELLSGMDEKAAARGMVVVYPQGVGTSWNAGGCCGRAKQEEVEDVRFVRDLVRELGSELCLDLNRVYSTGMSNGGIFSYRLACEASDLIAAIAPVAAVEALAECKPRRPVPLLAFNGTSDPLVSYYGGRFGFPSVAETEQRWAARNQCGAGEARTVFEHDRARCEAREGCAAEVVFCRLEGGGHTWPGGMTAPFLGRTNSDIDATSTLLDFFLDHPLRR